ncbi:hypothetical protein EHQ68_07230 [Leptospira congkakensis]|uniref:Metal-dependent HD superfamily phosphohydrolase n=1 Tax=Leptospira congkakensis TaxID=2484932 RepID=A0A4Z1A1B4_9LEPT|nr:hypothetical protein [Leptospira congkakensis]TGL87600.1 hypothetical protein EHQ69_15930 [Leptospira congkakensis]TGL89785.1 hypothetical protein EHQ68_07230 [Leptospira congkakensis]TGL95750.1 hypothetical protein EHQ70_11600 [Leptospira congkakensis]
MTIREECKTRFESLISNFIDAGHIVSQSLWKEIETRYSEPHRAYHNLNHLYQMLGEFEKVKTRLEDSEMVLFALYYHDLIYNPNSKSNEEGSAKIAEERLSQLGIVKERIGICLRHILATKSHRLGESYNPDTKYFLDMDLSILGSDEKLYLEYTKNIRKEYAIYSDDDYRKGRIQVLYHFIETTRLFQTDDFFDQYEMRSRHNLKTEIHSLQKGELF